MQYAGSHTLESAGTNGAVFVESSDDAATTTLTVLGPLTDDRKRMIDRAVKCLAHTPASLVLDLRGCPFCDPGTLALIVDWKRCLCDRLELLLSERTDMRRFFEIPAYAVNG